MFVRKLSDNTEIDLLNLEIREINLLQCEEEIKAVEIVKTLPPFSVERNELLTMIYDFAHKTKEVVAKKEGKLDYSLGASNRTAQLVSTIVDVYCRKINKKKICFYEAGIGRGVIIDTLHNQFSNLVIKGCDFIIDPKLKDNNSFFLFEGSLFECLTAVDDNSIDIFYSNDVIEHIPDDEREQTIDLIYRKCCPEGIMITITPNKLLGPYDVTNLCYPIGTKARGTHFHEYTYNEFLSYIKTKGFHSALGIVANPLTRKSHVSGNKTTWLVHLINRFTEYVCMYVCPISWRWIVLSAMKLCSFVVIVKKTTDKK
jgi:hypothetical protein